MSRVSRQSERAEVAEEAQSEQQESAPREKELNPHNSPQQSGIDAVMVVQELWMPAIYGSH